MIENAVYKVIPPGDLNPLVTLDYLDGWTGGVGGEVSGVGSVGEIFWWPTDTAPEGTLWCNGDAISRVGYKDLFDIIGIIYGNGDGTTTFNLPDLRGYFIRGYDPEELRDVGGNRPIGTPQEDSDVAFLTSQITLDENQYNEFITAWVTNEEERERYYSPRPINLNMLPCIRYKAVDVVGTISSGMPFRIDFIATESQQVFDLEIDIPVEVQVYKNGILMRRIIDYNIVGTTIVFVRPVFNEDYITVLWLNDQYVQQALDELADMRQFIEELQVAVTEAVDELNDVKLDLVDTQNTVSELEVALEEALEEIELLKNSQIPESLFRMNFIANNQQVFDLQEDVTQEIQVYKNGILMQESVDYNINGAEIEFIREIFDGDFVSVLWLHVTNIDIIQLKSKVETLEQEKFALETRLTAIETYLNL